MKTREDVRWVLQRSQEVRAKIADDLAEYGPFVPPEHRACSSRLSAFFDHRIAMLEDMLADRLPLDTAIPRLPEELLELPY
jgi:hypothetical protein